MTLCWSLLRRIVAPRPAHAVVAPAHRLGQLLEVAVVGQQRRRNGQVAVERIGPRLPEILLRCGIVGMRGTETERQTEGLRQIDFAQESLRLVARIAGQVYRIAVDRLVEIAAAVGEFAAAVVEVGRVEEPLRTGIGDAELPEIGGRIAARTQQAG